MRRERSPAGARSRLSPRLCGRAPRAAAEGGGEDGKYPLCYAMTKLPSALSLAVVLLSSGAAAAGGLPLQVPGGWESRRQDAALTMTPRDVGGGKVYTVVVPDVTSPMGSVRALLEAGKAAVGQAGAFKPANEPAAARNEQGWDYEVVIGPLEKDGKTLFAEVLGVKKGDDEGIIIVIADSVETLQKYSDPFTAMVRSMGASISPPPSPASAPASAPASGQGTDVKFSVPEGWTAKPIEGGVLLEKAVNTFYDKYTLRMVVMSSQKLTDSLRKTFVANWTATVTSTMDTNIVPLPLMRRLANGAAVAYDLDSNTKTKNGSQAAGGLVVVAQGTRYVPVMLVFFGAVALDEKLEADVTTVVGSIQMPGAGDGKVAMYAPSELVGDWSESSTSFANYVTSSGNYAGDASISTATYVTIKADGTFKRSFVGMKSGLTIKEKTEGTWKLEDGILVQTGNGSKERNTYIVHGVGIDPKVGAFLVLSTYANADEKPRLCNPRGPFQGTWFKRKD